ncbi:hypothetical protein TNCV_1338671 [Trichonephila clavipes]|nr:hypothetical protein TNCV_1338671 [Trichonephila clavipes]
MAKKETKQKEKPESPKLRDERHHSLPQEKKILRRRKVWTPSVEIWRGGAISVSSSSLVLGSRPRYNRVENVTDSWLTCHEFKRIVPLKTRRVEVPLLVKSVEAQTSSRLCGVELRRECWQLRFRLRHLTEVQNYDVRFQYPHLVLHSAKLRLFLVKVREL